MPEPPDFDQLARNLVDAYGLEAITDRGIAIFIAAELRQVWNARGEDVADVVQEAHERLDRAGVPAADGLLCDDAACNTKLGHRIKLLIAERDELRRLLDDVSTRT